MSIFETIDLPCPSCSEPVSFDVVHSVNVDRRQDLRDAIVDGSFQRRTCGACDTEFRMEPEFTYLDVARGQWIAARPAHERGDWQAREKALHATWRKAFGDQSNAAARKLGTRLSPRVTFGWAALREKLVATEAGLSDVDLELTKLALMRGGSSVVTGGMSELRLAAVEDEDGGADEPTLIFGWLSARTEIFTEGVQAPRGIYDDIAADDDAWQPLREELQQGLMVDLHRLA